MSWIVKPDSNDYDDVVSKSIQKNEAFFGINSPDLVVEIVETRGEMDQKRGHQTLDWVVGGVNPGTNRIIIFSPEAFKKVANRPESDFPKVLTHEIAHLFTPYTAPQWLREGIAGYVAGQLYPLKKDQITPFQSLHEEWKKYNSYAQAYSFTRFLIETYGKEMLFELLKALGQSETYSNFTEKFKRIYKKEFDSVVNTWRAGS